MNLKLKCEFVFELASCDSVLKCFRQRWFVIVLLHVYYSS